MTDLRQFIKNLGDNAPKFFDTKETTVKRWLKTGSLPFKATQKILMAIEATQGSQAPVTLENGTVVPAPNTDLPQEPAIDPVTKLPVDMRRGNFQIQGTPPNFIEEDPREQSFGLNTTRPGRMPQPLPPMKIKKVDGQDVAYVDNHPRTPIVMPPTMPTGADWNKPLERPEPQPKKTS